MYSRSSFKQRLLKEFEPLGAYRAFSADAERLLVYLENLKRKDCHEEPLHCYVVESGGNNQFSETLKIIVNLSKLISKVVRLQLLVKQGGHYTTVDIKLAPGLNEFIILDSAGDPRLMAHYLKMANLSDEDSKSLFFAKSYIVVGMKQDLSDTIQKDCYSCPIFAFDFARQISRMDDIYEYVSNKADSDGYITWSQMPPQLVWNAQSLDWIKVYAENNPSDIDRIILGANVSFSQYIDNANRDEHNENYKINLAAIKLFSDIASEAKQFIDIKNDDVLIDIIEQSQIVILDQTRAPSAACIIK